MNSTIDLTHAARDLGPKLAQGVDERDERDAFVADNYALLKEQRIFSALVPTELGGGGATHSQMCAFLRTIASSCASTALALSMHQHLVAAAVFNDRAGKPGRKLLERVATNQTVLVSTGARDWMDSNGAVERVEGGYRVSARKPFASGAPAGGILVTSAPYEDPQHGWQVLHFPVPFSAEGLSVADDWRTLGMRATGSHTVVLDAVFVPEENVSLRRPRGAYHPAWNVILTMAMPLIMSVYVGAAEEAARIAGGFLARRGDDPVALQLAGELTNRLTTAQLALADMIRIANDLDFEPTAETANAILVRKTIAANSVLAATEKAMEAVGGGGFYRSLGLERLLRDVHGAQFHPLPEKQQLLFTGRFAAGLDPISGAGRSHFAAAAE